MEEVSFQDGKQHSQTEHIEIIHTFDFFSCSAFSLI